MAMENYSDLAEEQRPAHLVFWYESEVQNGGHMQYFENRKGDYLNETIAALGLLGATCHQKVLQGAAQLFLSRERSPIQTVGEYCAIALEGEFDEFDSRFHDCSPSLMECLEAYLQLHQSSFVIVA